MYKILFYNNDLELIKNFCNNLFNSFSTLKLIGIATTEKEFKFLCKNSDANMVLITNKDMDNPNISHLIKKFEAKIIICDDTKNFKSSKHTLFISHNSSFASLREELNCFISRIDESIVYRRVYKVLQKLNFNFRLNGTNYLIDAIVYSYINKEAYVVDNLEKNVYPFVATKFNVTPLNVKWSIVRSINSMNSNINNSNLKDFLLDKITSKSLISEIVNHLN